MSNDAKHIAHIRQEYLLATLHESDLLQDPVQQFQLWFQHALNAEVEDVNAMTLSTVGPANRPHARIVLLKDIEQGQVIFFTNYMSRKAMEMASNPAVSIVFHWKELQRQVRIEGFVSKISEQASAEYFQSRPRESQLGAWASYQSQVLPHRIELEERFEALRIEYDGKTIPKPPHWGGYAVTPDLFEFWQGRESRLHDRFRYILDANGTWMLNRLNP
jgi:pyridoxamine 5'-phosphate oxidase